MTDTTAAARPTLTGLRAASLIALGVLLFTALPWALPAWMVDVPDWLILPLTARVGDGLNWFAREATFLGVAVSDITRSFAAVVNAPINALNMLLANGYTTGAGFNRVQIAPPLSWVGLIGCTVLLAWRLSGPGLAGLVAGSGLYLVTFGLWASAMTTLASVLVCVVIALVVGLALGVWSYRSPRAEVVARGTMNVMQTVPIFAYLIPTLMLFGYGPSAALLATVIYALPPMVHATVLALRAVPQETRELARMTGCTRAQTLWKVELPVAVPRLAIGLNQVVMMTLNMVIIASMIGAGGLGYDVLRALRRLDIGVGLQAGLGIVVLAVVMDRLTQAAARAQSAGRRGVFRRADPWMALAMLVIPTGLALAVPALSAWPPDWVLTTAPMWNDLVSHINRTYFDALETLRTTMLLWVMLPLRNALLAAPFGMVIALVALAGYAAGGRRTALICTGLTAFIAVAGYWDAAMVSLYLVTLSVGMAIAVGMPLGIWLAGRPRMVGPATLVLDALQTLPTLVYLLPAVMLFRNGDFSALIAVTSYALAPAVRYGMQSMRHVSPERIEAATMSGCTRWQTFRHVRLPAATPTLLLGVNQTMMMALSMLIIAALVGTRDLGQEVFTALSRANTGEGLVAGLCVAALALTADALLKALSAGREAKLRAGHG